MHTLRIQELLTQIKSLHPEDTAMTVSTQEQESSMISLTHVPPFTRRYAISIKPHYLAKYHALGETDGVLAQLVRLIENKLRLERIEQNCVTYRTALRALKEPQTDGFPSVLHAGSQAVIHEIPIRELAAFYWLAASDDDMIFADAFAEHGNNPTQRDSLVQTSIENFIGLIAEYRRAHNDQSANPAQIMDSPSCLPGTFGRIILRSSIYNKLTEVNGAIFAAIVPEIRNFIAQLVNETSDEKKTALYRFISDKLITFSAAVGQQDNIIAFLETYKTHVFHDRLIATLSSVLPVINLQNSVVKNALIEIYQLELMTLSLQNDMPSDNFIDQIRKVTYAPLALQCFSQLTEHDAEIIQTRLDIFAQYQRLCAFNQMIIDEIMKVTLIPAFLFDDEMKKSNQRCGTLLLEKYVFDFENAKSKLHQLLYSREQSFLNHNLNEEGIRIPPPAALENALRKRTRITDERLLNAIKNYETLADAFRTQTLSIHVEDDSIHIDRLPLAVHPSYDDKRSIAEKWAWNLLRVICSVYPKNPIKLATPALHKWVKLMVMHLDDNTITTCLETLQCYTQQLTLPTNEICQIMNTLSAVLREHHLTFAPLHESIDLETVTIEFNQLFSEHGNLDAWKQRACDLLSLSNIHTDSESSSASEDADNRWSQDLDLLPTPLIESYVLMTIVKNLHLSEIRIRDAQALKWIVRHYIHPELPSEFKFCQFSRDKHGLAAHIVALITTLKPIANLYNTGFVRLMSSEEAQTILLSKQTSDPNPCLFRVSNTYPQVLALSYSKQGQIQHQLLSNAYMMMPENINLYAHLKPLYAKLQGKNYGFTLFTSRAITTFITMKNLTPQLGLIPFCQQTTNVHQNKFRNKMRRSLIDSHEMDAPNETYLQGANQVIDDQERIYQGVRDSIYGDADLNTFTFFRNNDDDGPVSAETHVGLGARPT